MPVPMIRKDSSFGDGTERVQEQKLSRLRASENSG
jgi:hypothetical protein